MFHQNISFQYDFSQTVRFLEEASYITSHILQFPNHFYYLITRSRMCVCVWGGGVSVSVCLWMCLCVSVCDSSTYSFLMKA